MSNFHSNCQSHHFCSLGWDSGGTCPTSRTGNKGKHLSQPLGLGWFEWEWPPWLRPLNYTLNCLGRIRRCSLLEEACHWGWTLRFQKTCAISRVCLSGSYLWIRIWAVNCCFSIWLAACLPPCSLPWWWWTLILWNCKPQIKCFLFNFFGHGILLLQQKIN